MPRVYNPRVRWPCVWILAAICSGCATPPPPVVVQPSQEALVLEAARVFLACVERDGADCRRNHPAELAIVGLEVLAFVRDAAPIELLGGLEPRAETARDAARLGRAIKHRLGTLEHELTRAGCAPARARPLGLAIRALADAARARMEALLLQDTAPAAPVREILEDVQILSALWVVDVTCQGPASVSQLFVMPASQGAVAPVVGVLSGGDPLATRPIPPTPRVPPDPAWVHPQLPAEEREL